MENNLIYLDSYILQKDMRIRMPKSIIANLNAVCGKSMFEFYYNPDNKEIVLKMIGDNDGK